MNIYSIFYKLAIFFYVVNLIKYPSITYLMFMIPIYILFKFDETSYKMIYLYYKFGFDYKTRCFYIYEKYIKYLNNIEKYTDDDLNIINDAIIYHTLFLKIGDTLHTNLFFDINNKKDVAEYIEKYLNRLIIQEENNFYEIINCIMTNKYEKLSDYIGLYYKASVKKTNYLCKMLEKIKLY